MIVSSKQPEKSIRAKVVVVEDCNCKPQRLTATTANDGFIYCCMVFWFTSIWCKPRRGSDYLLSSAEQLSLLRCCLLEWKCECRTPTCNGRKSRGARGNEPPEFAARTLMKIFLSSDFVMFSKNATQSSPKHAILCENFILLPENRYSRAPVYSACHFAEVRNVTQLKSVSVALKAEVHTVAQNASLPFSFLWY